MNKFTPKTTLNKINLALTVVAMLGFGGLHYLKASAESFFYPDSSDCHKYFEVVNGAVFSRTCPADLKFCPELDACAFEDESACTYYCGDGGSGIIQKNCYTVFSTNKSGTDYYASCSDLQNGDIIYQCGAISIFEPLWGLTPISKCYQYVGHN